MSNAHEKTSVSEGLNDFIQRNRKPIFVLIGIAVVLVAGSIATLSIMDVVRKKAIVEAEELNRRYEALRFSIAEESSSADVEALLGDLNAFAKKTFGYANGKAWSIVAGIHSDKKEWAEAESAWRNAAKAGAKTYQAAVAWFNAAAVAEEQGKTAEAIDCYAKSAAVDSPSAPRAQFSVGRLQEAQNDTAAAIEAYRAVIANWPYDTVWTNFAHSRIIALESK